MGNDFNVSLTDRLAQSHADRASNLAAMGNWSLGTTTTSGTNLNNFYGDSIRYWQTYDPGAIWGSGGSGGTLTEENLRTAIRGLQGYYGEDKSEEQKTKAALKVLDKIKGSAKAFEAKEQSALGEEAKKYRELGMTAIAERLESKTMKAWKEFEISAAGYKRMNASEVKAFRDELRKIGDSRSKRDLIETPLEAYVGQGIAEAEVKTEENMGVPPAEVLEKLKVAKDSKLFDAFSVLHIKYVDDPILCGKINESNDLYFIAEWGNDVKFTDIVKQ